MKDTSASLPEMMLGMKMMLLGRLNGAACIGLQFFHAARTVIMHSFDSKGLEAILTMKICIRMDSTRDKKQYLA